MTGIEYTNQTLRVRARAPYAIGVAGKRPDEGLCKHFVQFDCIQRTHILGESLRANDRYLTLLLKRMVLLVDVVMDLVYVTVLLLVVVVLRSGDSLDPHQGKVWSGKKKKIRAAGIEPATLRLLRSSHYSLTLYQLS